MPALLAGGDEKKVVSLLVAVHAAIAIVTVGLLAWLIRLPLLFPALGPTAFLLFTVPFSAASAPRAVILGHTIGILCGLGAWTLSDALGDLSITPASAGWLPVFSATSALVASSILLVLTHCPHAPACSSAIIVALGAATTWTALLGMFAGVVILAVQAVALERLAGLNVPSWSPRPHACGTSGTM